MGSSGGGREEGGEQRVIRVESTMVSDSQMHRDTSETREGAPVSDEHASLFSHEHDAEPSTEARHIALSYALPVSKGRSDSPREQVLATVPIQVQTSQHQNQLTRPSPGRLHPFKKDRPECNIML